MVILEGWDDEGKFWVMRNSWGTGRGGDGYMKIKYTDRNTYKCNNIGSTAAFAVLNEKLVLLELPHQYTTNPLGKIGIGPDFRKRL